MIPWQLVRTSQLEHGGQTFAVVGDHVGRSGEAVFQIPAKCNAARLGSSALRWLGNGAARRARASSARAYSSTFEPERVVLLETDVARCRKAPAAGAVALTVEAVARVVVHRSGACSVRSAMTLINVAHLRSAGAPSEHTVAACTRWVMRSAQPPMRRAHAFDSRRVALG
jgi:hypothetical protein